MPRHAVFLTILLPLVGTASPLPTVAVFPLQGRGLDSNAVRIFEDALGDGLARSGKVRLLERGRMDAVLKEQGFQASGICDGSECAVEMGRLLGVQRGVVGAVGHLGETYVLNARLIDIGSGEVLASSQRSLAGKVDEALKTLVPKAVEDLTVTSGAEVAGGAPASGGGHRAWLWWTAGGVAVAGGIAAAVILASGDGTTSASASGGGQESGGGTSSSSVLKLRWIGAN